MTESKTSNKPDPSERISKKLSALWKKLGSETCGDIGQVVLEIATLERELKKINTKKDLHSFSFQYRIPLPKDSQS
jgi:hypothetical protein